MATIAFDTLKFAKRLKDAGVLPAQAEAEAEALAEVLEVNLKDLATKEDLLASKKDLQQEIRESELRLKTEVANTKAELIRWVVGVGMLQITLIAALLLRLAPG